jgi:hypothetical protein
MKLPIDNEKTTVTSYRLKPSTIANIEKLAKENKTTCGKIVDYAIKQLMGKYNKYYGNQK